MARYGREMNRQRMGMHDFTEQGGGTGGRGFGGRGGPRGDRSGGEGMIGGMRSDAGGTRWDRFPGEEGWLGQGSAGYPGGEPRGGRGYAADFRPGTGRGGPGGLDRFGGRPTGDFGAEFRGDLGLGRGADADRIRARDIMTDDPSCVTPDTSVTDVAQKMRDLDIGIIPVVEDMDNRRLRGVVTDRDLAIRVLAEGKDGKSKIKDYMTGPVEAVNQNDSVRDVLDVMKREQVRRVPVTDREGRLVGVIAQADLAVDYAGLDLHRETEVEEVIERISEPARPRGR